MRLSSVTFTATTACLLARSCSLKSSKQCQTIFCLTSLGNFFAKLPVTSNWSSPLLCVTVTTSPSNVPSSGLTAKPKTSKPTLTLPIDAGAKTETLINVVAPMLTFLIHHRKHRQQLRPPLRHSHVKQKVMVDNNGYESLMRFRHL